MENQEKSSKVIDTAANANDNKELYTTMKDALSPSLDRMNPHQYPLALESGRRASSVSPDRATTLCETRRLGKAEVELSQTRNYVLLTVFSLGVFIDGESNLKPVS